MCYAVTLFMTFVVWPVKDLVPASVTLVRFSFERPTIKWFKGLELVCCVSCPRPSRGRLSKSFCIRGTVQRPLPGPKPSRKRSRDICLNTTSSGSRTHVSPFLVICLLVKGCWPGHHLNAIVKPPLALSWHFCFRPGSVLSGVPGSQLPVRPLERQDSSPGVHPRCALARPGEDVRG